jgi:DNA-binding transcriptional LysR family regulator
MHNPPPHLSLRVRLKTRQLLLLVALDAHRNIHRAADALHMTQPAASKQLKGLEDMLEVRLFARLARGMEPTMFGVAMIHHARMALTSLALAHEDIDALKEGLPGQVAIGAIMSPSLSLLPRAIARVKAAAPLMRVGVEIDSSNVLLGRLRHGHLDFLVARILNTDVGAQLQYEELADEPVCVVARVGHPLQGAVGIELADLAASAWILAPHGSTLRHRCDTMFRRAGRAPPANVVDTTALLLIVPLLQQTDSLHLMPLDVARHYVGLNMLGIVPVDVPIRMDGFGIVTRRNQLLSPAAGAVLDAIRAVARETQTV